MTPKTFLGGLLIATLFCAPALGQPLPLERCRAIDGDTIACGAERIRVRGLDAPELHARCAAEQQGAMAARDRMSALMQDGIFIIRRGHDKYGRTLADIYGRNGFNLAHILVQEGLARPYDGRGQRQGWCR